MEIKQAIFVTSSSAYKQCPDTGLPEYAFIGRSNVGKSSLINMLTGVKGLAKTSSSPGKTQLINHFLINNQWYLVDLPGYGYARTSKSSRDRWLRMTRDYLLLRQTLTCVFVLLDSRIKPLPIDVDFIQFLGENGLPLALVFTKTDKQNQRETAQTVNTYRQLLLQTWEELPPIMLTSSQNGHGRTALLDYIDHINQKLMEAKDSQ